MLNTAGQRRSFWKQRTVNPHVGPTGHSLLYLPPRALSKCQLDASVTYGGSSDLGRDSNPRDHVLLERSRRLASRSGGRGCWVADELADGGVEVRGVGERGEVIQLGQGLRTRIGQHLSQDRDVLAEPGAGPGPAEQEGRRRDPGRLGRPEGPGAHRRQLVGEEVGRLALRLHQAFVPEPGLQDLPVAVAAHPAHKHVERAGDVALGRGRQRGTDIGRRGRLPLLPRGLGRFEQDQAGDQAGVVQRELQPDAAAGGLPEPVGAGDAEPAQQRTAAAGGRRCWPALTAPGCGRSPAGSVGSPGPVQGRLLEQRREPGQDGDQGVAAATGRSRIGNGGEVGQQLRGVGVLELTLVGMGEGDWDRG
jgi:hypothetical protein